MAKHITFTYHDGNRYTLEFNRDTVQSMESRGFNLNKIAESPATYIPVLFAGALRMHHRKLKPAMVDKMYENFGDKEKLVPLLIEMYSETLDTLMDDPEDEAKKVTWEASWSDEEEENS